MTEWYEDRKICETRPEGAMLNDEGSEVQSCYTQNCVHRGTGSPLNSCPYVDNE